MASHSRERKEAPKRKQDRQIKSASGNLFQPTNNPSGGDDQDNSSGDEREGTVEMELKITDPSSVKDKISELMDALESKRSSNREDGLRDFKKFQMLNVLTPYFEGREETFVELMKKGMKKGGDDESRLSAENLALFFLVTGPNNQNIFNDTQSLLQDSTRNHTCDASQAAFVDALSFGCFVACGEYSQTISVLEFLEEVFSRAYSPQAVAAAIQGWGLLATTMPQSFFEQAKSRVLKQLRKHLESEDYDVRLASGTSIALIVEQLREEENPLEIPEEILILLKDLANESSRYIAKKEKTRQRSAFREIVKSIERNEAPFLSLKFKFETIEFNSWSQILQLEFVRNVLGVGLHIHFLCNDIVRQFFDLPPAHNVNGLTPTKLSSVEKRMLYSPNAKARSKWLDSRRKTKTTSHHGEN